MKTLLSTIDMLTSQGVVLAYSGGVDSALLLKLLFDASQKKKIPFYAVILESTLGSKEEVKDALALAQEIGCSPVVIKADPLQEAGLKENPFHRCYLCKKYLFGLIINFAKEKGILTVVDGTNADDLKTYRPGLEAISEYHIQSPLAACHITKEMVRSFAKELGLSFSQKPSSPCLATRFPYGATLSQKNFQAVFHAEKMLKELGFNNVRVRKYDSLARIEIDSPDFERFIAQKDEIIKKFKTFGFIYVTLDIEGFRSGSMDLIMNKEN